MNMIIVENDPVLTDAYVANLMGFRQRKSYIEWLSIGAGTADLANADIIELNKDIRSVNQCLQEGYNGKVCCEDSACQPLRKPYPCA